jgi:hypothetical protein
MMETAAYPDPRFDSPFVEERLRAKIEVLEDALRQAEKDAYEWRRLYVETIRPKRSNVSV